MPWTKDDPMQRPLLAWCTAWLSAAVYFLAMDAVWLTLMTPRLYRPELGALLGSSFDAVAAVLFYALYFTGMVGLAIAPALQRRRIGMAARRGALLGLVAYGTYDLTNQATLQAWSWKVTLADLAWGCVATMVASALACATALALVRWRARKARAG